MKFVSSPYKKIFHLPKKIRILFSIFIFGIIVIIFSFILFKPFFKRLNHGTVLGASTKLLALVYSGGGDGGGDNAYYKCINNLSKATRSDEYNYDYKGAFCSFKYPWDGTNSCAGYDPIYCKVGYTCDNSYTNPETFHFSDGTAITNTPCKAPPTPTPTPIPPPSQGQKCGLNSDAGAGTCQESCSVDGATTVSSSNNNCGQYYFGDGGYQRQYLCCIPPVYQGQTCGLNSDAGNGTCQPSCSGSSHASSNANNNCGDYQTNISADHPDYARLTCCISNSSAGGPPNVPCGNGSYPPGNDNGWCGTDNNVYYCYKGTWSIKTKCSNGCQVNAGVADTCKGSDQSGQSGQNNTSSTTSNNTPTPTDTPTDTPTETPIPPSDTPTGPIHTTASITVHIQGIDTSNIPNIVPAGQIHGKQGWPFTLYVYQAKQSLSSTPYQVYSDTLQEITDANSPFYGMFQNTAFKLYNSYHGLPSGDYKFVVRTPMGSLRKQIGNGTFTITAWASNNLVTPDAQNIQLIPKLLMGDLNGDNVINIVDLNILFDCYGEKSTQATCLADKNSIIQSFPSLSANFLPADLNDNGKVDGIDFNTLLDNFGDQGN